MDAKLEEGECSIKRWRLPLAVLHCCGRNISFRYLLKATEGNRQLPTVYHIGTQ